MNAQETIQKIKPGQAVEILYASRDIGYGVESGILTGWFTGEVDTWGKRTFRIDGTRNACHACMYLFDDEILSVEEVAQ